MHTLTKLKIINFGQKRDTSDEDMEASPKEEVKIHALDLVSVRDGNLFQFNNLNKYKAHSHEELMINYNL